MKLKAIVTTVALGLAATSVAFADAGVSQQIAQLQAQLHALQNQVSHMSTGAKGGSAMGGLVSTNANLTNNMLNNFNGVGREMYILQARKHNMLANKSVYVGGYGEFDAVYDHANTQAAAGHREVNSATAPKSYSAIKVRQADVTLTGTIDPWVAAFLDLGTPRASLSTVNSLSTNAAAAGTGSKFAVQQAYLVVGNLNQSPYYGFIGRKDIDFGQFASVNPYSQPLNRLAFQATGNTLGLGTMQHGVDATVSIMNGGSDAVNHPHTTTVDSGKLDNYALNFGYGQTGMPGVDGLNWHVGAGWIRGTSVSKNSGGTNGAWDLNAKASFQNFDALFEYTRTTSDVTPGNHAAAWQLAGDYKLPVMGRKSVASLSYSQVKGHSGSTGSAKQYVVGFRNETFNNVWLGLEYAYDHNTLQDVGVRTAGGITGSNADNNVLTFDVTTYF